MHAQRQTWISPVSEVGCWMRPRFGQVTRDRASTKKPTNRQSKQKKQTKIPSKDTICALLSILVPMPYLPTSEKTSDQQRYDSTQPCQPNPPVTHVTAQRMIFLLSRSPKEKITEYSIPMLAARNTYKRKKNKKCSGICYTRFWCWPSRNIEKYTGINPIGKNRSFQTKKPHHFLT